MNWEEMLGEFNSRSVSNKKRNNMSWLRSLFSGGLGIVGSIIQNAFNVRQQKEVNKNNRELVQMQNDAAAAESEKAYKRSLPVNQVGNMRAAGMSHAAAINALNDGGSYQPAPVNTAQDQAPQIDLSQAINAVQSAAALKEQKRQFDMQHELAERQQMFEERKYNEGAELRGAELRSALANAGIAEAESTIYKIEAEIQTARKQGRLEAEKLQDVADMAAAVLAKFRDDQIYNAMQKLTPQEIQNLFEVQAYMSMIEHGIKHDAMNAVWEGAKKLGSIITGGKFAGRNIRMH